MVKKTEKPRSAIYDRSPEWRSERARKAAQALHASKKYTPQQLTQAARAAFKERFVRQVDPNNELPEDEGNRRAEAARRAWYADLALKSSKARAAKKAEAPHE